MLIIPLFIVLLVGFASSFSYAVINLDAATQDWTVPILAKLWLLLKSMFWAVISLLAAGGLFETILETQF